MDLCQLMLGHCHPPYPFCRGDLHWRNHLPIPLSLTSPLFSPLACLHVCSLAGCQARSLGFSPAAWLTALNALSWPEVLRQYARAAGVGRGTGTAVEGGAQLSGAEQGQGSGAVPPSSAVDGDDTEQVVASLQSGEWLSAALKQVVPQRSLLVAALLQAEQQHSHPHHTGARDRHTQAQAHAHAGTGAGAGRQAGSAELQHYRRQQLQDQLVHELESGKVCYARQGITAAAVAAASAATTAVAQAIGGTWPIPRGGAGGADGREEGEGERKGGGASPTSSDSIAFLRVLARLTPGTVKYAVYNVLAYEGAQGLTVADMARKMKVRERREGHGEEDEGDRVGRG